MQTLVQSEYLMHHVLRRPLIKHPLNAQRVACIRHHLHLNYCNQFHLFQFHAKYHQQIAHSRKSDQYTPQAAPLQPARA